MPVATVFENLELGTNIEDIDEQYEQYNVTRAEIKTVLEFAAKSLGLRGTLPIISSPAFGRVLSKRSRTGTDNSPAASSWTLLG